MRTTPFAAEKRQTQNLPEVMASIRDLRKSFGDRDVLKGVNLDLYRSENLVILGRSGTGKSVLIKCMVGLMKPDSGAIVPTLALSGVAHDGVDVLDVPGLGTRRIVLRRFDRRRSPSTPVDTVARLLRESAGAFDTRSPS